MVKLRLVAIPALAGALALASLAPASAAPEPASSGTVVRAKWYTVCDLNQPNPYPFDFVLTSAEHANSKRRSIRIAVTSAKSMYGTWLMAEGGGGKMLPENSKFDAQTVRAMKRFQRAKGIKPTGKIGSVTWAALGQYCADLI